MTEKRWFLRTVAAIVVLLLLAMSLVIIVDPYFHYRAPRTDLFAYTLDKQRFQNDGIVRHFDYEALVTGSSMCENFKASDIERLWGLKTVKVTFSGASYRELSRIVCTAARHNPKLKLVIVGIDLNKLLYPCGWMRNDLGTFPDYLYDENLWNDIRYWLNHDALLKSLKAVCRVGKGAIPSFDDYSAWHDAATLYGADVVLRGIALDAQPQHPEQAFTESDRQLVAANFKDNFLPMIKVVPQVYFFITPYSEVRMEIWRKSGLYPRQMAAVQELKRLMSSYLNVRIFDFTDHIEITGNLDNYRDIDHYGPWINSWMLEQMRETNK